MTQLGDYRGGRPRFAPDGNNIAADDSGMVWIHDLKREGARTRLMPSGQSFAPVWSTDGKRIVASTYEGGPAQLWSYSSSNSTDRHRVSSAARRRYAASFTPDGRTLAFIEAGAETGSDIWTVTDDSVATPLLNTPHDEGRPRFSPDGRVLAFDSNESGREEVYVQAYPNAGRAIPVSINGGSSPVWNGRELFFLRGDEIHSVTVGGDTQPDPGEPRFVVRVPGIQAAVANGVTYDISPDGRRFVVSLAPLPPKTRELHVVIGLRAPRKPD
jgi:serine/threonine-protein kinase